MEPLAIQIAHVVSRALELAGVTIIAVGAIVTLVELVRELFRSKNATATAAIFRSSLGRAILLALEFLIAADIINTVAVRPTLMSVAVLAGIVAIRIFLSFSLQLEIEGRWPWQRRPAEKRKL